MTKWAGSPMWRPCWRRTRTHIEWNVAIIGARIPAGSRSASTRRAISLAALLVNVTARRFRGERDCPPVSQAIRYAMTRVLPLPAPASTSSGPSPTVTASRCGGFRSSRRRSSPRSTGRLYRAIGVPPTPSRRRASPAARTLSDRDALGEVPRLVHVAAEPHRDVVGEELERNDRDQRRQQIGARGHLDDVLRLRGDRAVARMGDGDDLAVAGAHLLDVAEHPVVGAVAGHQRDDRQPIGDERDRAVLHLAAGVPLGVDVRDLLQLERALERDRELEAPAQEQEVAGAGQLAGDRRNLLVELERPPDQARDPDQILAPLAHIPGGDRAPLAAEPQPEEVRGDDHRGKRLRRRDANLRSGVHVEDAGRLAGQRGADDVRDGKNRAAL